jgi:hypothetical protein
MVVGQCVLYFKASDFDKIVGQCVLYFKALDFDKIWQ